jgi:hypothetical protein
LTSKGIVSIAVNTTDHPSNIEGIGWVASSAGLAQIRFEWWTLEQKAYYLEEMNRVRHNRFGLVSSCQLQRYGDLSSYLKVDGDNDGSWTCLYVASEMFRYQVTQETEASDWAWESFGALEFV